MKKKSFLLSLLLCLLMTTTTMAKDVNILDFGAKPDGVTLNTKAIQAAIDKAAKTGGGRVTVPAGKFLTGSIEMRSNTELHIEKDGVILGSTDFFSDYHKLTGHWSLILASNVENISFTGEGTIDGQGRKLSLKVDSLYYIGKLPEDQYDLHRPDESTRPTLLQVLGCKNIKLEGLNWTNSACWCLQFWGCENIDAQNVRIHSYAYGNNDGIDLGDCRHVLLRKFDVQTSDDGICLKGSWNDDFLIEDCRIQSNASAIKFGSGAGASNVKIRNIYVYDTYRSCLALECVYNTKIENIEVDGLAASNVWNVIYLRLSQRNPKNPRGLMRNISIRNVTADVPLARPDINYEDRHPGYSYPLNANPLPAMIVGVPEMYIENVNLENIYITYPGGGDEATAYAPYWRMKSLNERLRQYPEFQEHGEMPSWGFYVRHAKNVNFKNVFVAAKKRDYRPAFAMDDVHGVSMQRVIISEDDKGPQVVLNNVSGTNIDVDKSLIYEVPDIELAHEQN